MSNTRNDLDLISLIRTARDTGYRQAIPISLGRNGRLWLVPQGPFDARYRWYVDIYPTKFGAMQGQNGEKRDRIAVWDVYDRKFVDSHRISWDLTLRAQMNALCTLEQKQIARIRKDEPGEVRREKERSRELQRFLRGLRG